MDTARTAPVIYPSIKRKVPSIIRVRKSEIFPVEKVLSAGCYLSTIDHGKNDRTCQRPGKIVRVIRYTHKEWHDATEPKPRAGSSGNRGDADQPCKKWNLNSQLVDAESTG